MDGFVNMLPPEIDCLSIYHHSSVYLQFIFILRNTNKIHGAHRQPSPPGALQG
jgi:hypothetical protein